MISVGCKTTKEFDNILIKKAIENADLSHESFQRSLILLVRGYKKLTQSAVCFPLTLITE